MSDLNLKPTSLSIFRWITKVSVRPRDQKISQETQLNSAQEQLAADVALLPAGVWYFDAEHSSLAFSAGLKGLMANSRFHISTLMSS